jgi:NhaP-type Na+/H+ or K+/H+ antiporter
MSEPPNEERPVGSDQPAPGSWRDTERRPRRDDRTWSILWGVVLLLVGGYFFVRQTLGIDLPDIRWSQLWPILLILIGVVIVYRSITRNRA